MNDLKRIALERLIKAAVSSSNHLAFHGTLVGQLSLDQKVTDREARIEIDRAAVLIEDHLKKLLEHYPH